MIPQLPGAPVPDWLAGLSQSSIESGKFIVERVLENSLYYPAAGLDGSPIKYLAGNVSNFVYADYGTNRDNYLKEVEERGFNGYHCIGMREVDEDELTPENWLFDSLDLDNDHRSEGRDPSIRPRVSRHGWMLWRGSRIRASDVQPFCYRSVWQRREEVPSTHGPHRFNLLYLCAEGVAAFKALYHANEVAPFAVAIIQSGAGFGGNWTNFEKPDGYLAKSVLANPSGLPKALIYGGIGNCEWYLRSCWPRHFGKHMCLFTLHHHYNDYERGDQQKYMSVFCRNDDRLSAGL